MPLAQIEIVFVLVGVFLLASLLFFFALGQILAPWIQAFMSGVPLSVLEIIGMRLRRTDVRAIVRAMVMAKQAGTPVSHAEMERAYLQGIDLEKVTLAFIGARKNGIEATFQELVAAEQEDRLREKLGL